MLGVRRLTFVTPICEIMLKHFDDERMKINQYVVGYEMEAKED
jgi:hypothetical protein